MDSLKNYAWAKSLNVPEKCFNDWKENKLDQNFLFWALAQKAIDRKEYFEWAVNFYNTPILKNVFFEQNSMNYGQWNKVKHLHKWSTEIAPVFVWEDVIFVGCLEVPKDHESWTFKHRLVLVTDLALRMHWKYIKDFKKLTEKSDKKINTALNNKSSLPEPDEDRFSSSENTNPERNHRTEENGPFYMKNFTTDLPPEKDNSIPTVEEAQMNKNEKELTKTEIILNHITSIIKNPLMKKESEQKEEIILNSKTCSEKPRLTNVKTTSAARSKPILNTKPVRSPSPEKPKLEVVEKIPTIDMETSPDASKEIDLDIIPTTFPSPEKPKLEDVEKMPTIDMETSPDASKEIDLDIDSKTSFIIKSEQAYKELFDQTKSTFKGSLILKNNDGRLFPVSWSGHVGTNLDTEKQIASLNDFSIFKVLGKGHAYHGFVVDAESNKKFFNNIGWPQYPKHVTAIPIKDEEDQLEFVFVGLSMHNLDRQSIHKIEQQILDYFSNFKSKKLAA